MLYVDHWLYSLDIVFTERTHTSAVACASCVACGVWCVFPVAYSETESTALIDRDIEVELTVNQVYT